MGIVKGESLVVSKGDEMVVLMDGQMGLYLETMKGSMRAASMGCSMVGYWAWKSASNLAC